MKKYILIAGVNGAGKSSLSHRPIFREGNIQKEKCFSKTYFNSYEHKNQIAHGVQFNEK